MRKYTSLMELIKSEISKNGQGFTNMYDKEMADLVYGNASKRRLIAKELKVLESRGQIKITGKGAKRRINI